MNTHADKTQKNKSQSVANSVAQKKSNSKSTFQLEDNRSNTTTQRKANENSNNETTIQRVGAHSNTFRLVVNGVTREEIEEAIDNIPGGNGGHAQLNGNAGFDVVIYAMHTLPVSTVRNSLRNQLPNAIIGAIQRSVEN